MDLSIVTTLYCSAPYVEEFYSRMRSAAEKLTNDYQMIFVNDGSPDESLRKVVSLQEKDSRLMVIELSRNFGHHKAMMTGLAHAGGELVFLIDSDLEEDPELLDKFHQEIKRSDADVVYGVQQTRTGTLFRRITGAVYYKLYNLLSTEPVPPNLITARLMSQKYVTALVEHREREISISGLWTTTGFKQVPLVVEKRDKGSSSYDLTRKVSTLVVSITSFSNKPLVFVFYLGCVIVFVSSVAAFYYIVRRLFFGVLLAGWPSLIVSIWLLGGLTIFCLGVIGIYLSKIYMETKQRPYTIIRKIYGRGEQT